MGWFSCRDCGEYLEKPEVAGHSSSCTFARQFSCIDCGVVLSQNTVRRHTQCISEAEYGPRGRNRLSSSGQGKPDKPKQNGDVDFSVGLSTKAPWGCSICDIKASGSKPLMLHAQSKRHIATAKTYFASQLADGKDQETERAVDNDATKRNRTDNIALEKEDNAQFQMLQSVVRVRSFKSHMSQPHYKSCPGIIVDVVPNKILIAVHSTNFVPHDHDTIRVCFHDSVVRTAKVFIEKTQKFRILEVVESNHNYQSVRSSNIKVGREDVHVFWNHGQKDLVRRRCPIINTSAAAVASSTDLSIVSKTDGLFTFGCKDGLQGLLGAPVFTQNGLFAGYVCGNHRTIPTDDDESGYDVIYARHAISFIPTMLKNIKNTLEEEEKKKKVGSQKSSHRLQEKDNPKGQSKLHADGTTHRAAAKAYSASELNNGKGANTERDVKKANAKRKTTDSKALEKPARRQYLSNLKASEVAESEDVKLKTKSKCAVNVLNAPNHQDTKKQKIKWKKMIVKILETHTDGVMKLKRLQKLVLRELQERGLSEDKEQLNAVLMEKVTSSRFSVHGKHIRLASKNDNA